MVIDMATITMSKETVIMIITVDHIGVHSEEVHIEVHSEDRLEEVITVIIITMIEEQIIQDTHLMIMVLTITTITLTVISVQSRSSSSTPTFIKKEGSEEFSENGAAMTNNSPNPHPSQQKYHASSSSQPPYSYQNSHYSNETQGYPKRDSQGSAPPYNRYNSRDKSFSYDQQKLSVKEPNTDSTTNQQSNIPEYDMKCNHWVSTLKLSGDLKESTNKLFEELDSVNKNINELYQKSFNLEIEVEKFGRLSRTENLKSRLTDEKLESINFV
ncbi:unnamed protein product [[Candida] boidinii]|uniref:Unnamed protein product n=1 Tax=Candida boidinii TaxID=5477 RepID=A0ACB5TQE7_CANBO|nr:unnamed protein product [[Candida] boidinii]